MKIFAAPLQGYTVKAFRNAHFLTIGGIEEYYTPFLRLEQNSIREKELSDIEKEQNLSPGTVPQILVKNGRELAFFAEKLGGELGWKRIDINWGCPYVPVVKRGYGAGVLEDPNAMKDVLKAMEKFPQIDFSVKCRLPEKEEELHILKDFRLKQIVLHPRKAIDAYKGTPRKEAFCRFVSSGITVPVIYNGDIKSMEDLAGLPELAGGVMIGRGLLSDPLLARKLNGEKFSPEEENTLYKNFHSSYVSSLTEGIRKKEEKLSELKLFWEYFLPQKDKRIRKKLFKCRTFEEYKDFTEELFSI